MPFSSATISHEASPLLKDHPPGQVHVVPSNDAKDHVVKLSEVCWCTPQVQDEGSGYSTHIHITIKPLVEGHNLQIKKVLIGKKQDMEFQVELPRR